MEAERNEEGRGVCVGGGREKKMGVKDRLGRGGGRRERKEKEKERQGREGGKKEDSDGDREGKKKTSTGLPMSTHTQSLSLFRLAGLDFKMYLQNTLCPPDRSF